MNRLLTFLIISVLFTQSAWAFHDIEFDSQQDHAYFQTSDQDDVNGDYDHCGHFSAHLVGLISNSTIDTYVTSNNNVIYIKNITSSISYQPPVPPPTS